MAEDCQTVRLHLHIHRLTNCTNISFKEIYIHIFSFSLQLPRFFNLITDKKFRHTECVLLTVKVWTHIQKVLGSNLDRKGDYTVIFGDCIQTVQAIFGLISRLGTDHSGRAVQGKMCLHPLEHWDRVFESHSRHGCLSAFILCLCCPA
jgi:hypothetical protein